MKTAKRILLTGFRPFAGHAANPSQQLVEALAAEEWGPQLAVRGALLDVSYGRAEAQFDAARKTFRPHAVISFGLDYGTEALKLERLAVNLDDATIADEDGETRSGSRIAARGPAARWSTLPLAAMHAAVTAAAVPVVFSAHAGTYLCNHLLYHALGRGRGGEAFRAGFVHLPPTPELLKTADRERRKGMDLATQLRAARVLVAVVAGARS